MKYTNFKTAALMLSATVLLGLSGCDGTEGVVGDHQLVGEITDNTTPVADAGKSQSHVVYVDEKGLIVSKDAFVDYRISKTSAPSKSKTESIKSTILKPSAKLGLQAEEQKTAVLETNTGSEKTSLTRMESMEGPRMDSIDSEDRNLTVTLDGTLSSDADGDTLTYQWKMVSKPGRSKAALNNATLSGPSFSADVIGDYVFELTVNDGEADSQISTVTISIKTYQQEFSKWENIGEGVQEGNTTRTYNAYGQVLTQHDENSNGYTEDRTYTYDANGNMLTQHYETSDAYTYDITYTYNANGNMLTQHYENSDAYTYDYTYTYDANGNMLTQHYDDHDGYTEDRTYTYDANGNMLTQHYETSDAYTYDITYTYNANGNMLTQHYENSNAYTYDYTYTYDANGNMLTQHYENSDGYTYDYTYTYDANGNMLTQHYENSDGYTEDRTNTYDANGNMLTQHYENSNAYTYDITYTYDANGNMLTQHYENSDGYTEDRTNTYDANGNRLTQHYENSYGYTEDRTNTYDANGNMLTQHYENSYGEEYTEEYTWVLLP